MSDKPILFSGPMVRALLAGTKTQTRRALKLQPFIDAMGNFCVPDRKGKVWNYGQDANGAPHIRKFAGTELRIKTGDRLYVRENLTIKSNDQDVRWLGYAADGKDVWPLTQWHKPSNSISSIHAPRWTSRLTLTVTDVRVERLLDISRADALSEGVESESGDPPFYYVPGILPHSLTGVGVEEPGGRYAERSYLKLWDHINGTGAAASNPWVAAYSFSVQRGNIEAEAVA